MGNKKVNKKNKKNKKKLSSCCRNYNALAAIMRNSAGPMSDKRTRRARSRKSQKVKNIDDGWE